MKYAKLIEGTLTYIRQSELSTLYKDEKTPTEVEVRDLALSLGYMEVVDTPKNGDITKWEIIDDKIVRTWIIKSVDAKRATAYLIERIISYDNTMLSVDQANTRALQLWAEGRTEDCDSLRALIATAKNEIRSRIM